MAISNLTADIISEQQPLQEAENNKPGINRREFLTYAWGLALMLVATESEVGIYSFMMPRFRAGEFGGQFSLGPANALPTADSLSPVPNADGKYWLVHTDVGLKALYMVCTHLGCLYKWSNANTRFECPCHGSKFTLNGDYIEGPAPRSLDQFEVQVVDNDTIVATTEDTPDQIVPPAIDDGSANIVIDTGKRILGKPATKSPARRVEA